MSAHSRSETAVHERIRPHDLVLFLVTLALLAVLPWMLVSAGGEPVEYTDQRTHTNVTVPNWIGLLAFLVPFLVWPGMKAWNLLAKPAAVTLGPGGIRLYDDVNGLYARKRVKAANLSWSEVQRIVLWRKRIHWLGFIPIWTSQVGLEKRDDWNEDDRSEPTAEERSSPGHRPDGSPIRLGANLNSRSVRLGAAAFKHVARAAAQYAPQVEAVDERRVRLRGGAGMGIPKPLAEWAQKTDRAEIEWARSAVDGWARTAEFSRPLQWGEAEAAVLTRDFPPLPGSIVVRLIGVIGWAAIGLMSIPLFGASVVGLVLVAIGCTRDGADAAQSWFSLASFAFVVTVIAVLTFLSMWWETRRRSLMVLVFNLVTVLASVAAFVVLAVSSASADGAWLPLLMLAAAVLGAVSLALGLMSKPEGRKKSRKPPRRGPRSSDKRARALRARKRLLEILIHRGLVDLDEGDRIRVAEMPLGYWSELDGLDERERRRVLELRHVGWREFD